MSSDSHSTIETDKQKIYITVEGGNLGSKTLNTKEVAVWKALFANIAIGSLKLICWLISHSSVMLSESVHSFADSFNSLSLLVGLKRGSRPADKLHPFGYGLEANIWALFACVFMLMGTAVAFYGGFERYINGSGEALELLKYYNYIVAALVGSILFELWAVSSASSAVMEEAQITAKNPFEAFIKSFEHIKYIKSPTTKFVWYEDTAALAGVIIALIALTISKFFVARQFAHIPDAIASIIIGCLLFALAVYLIRHNINFLTGAAAGPQIEEKIRDITSTIPGVSSLHELKTMDMGSSGLIVNMSIEVEPETQVKDADDIVERLEEKIRERVPRISHVNIEMQADDAEDNWEERFEKLILEGKKLGFLNPREAKMLGRFFDFTDTVVYEIMVPRTEVTFVSTEISLNELIDLIVSSGHTRIPVYRESIDDIIGVVNAKDILRIAKEKAEEEFKLEDIVREITLVPENKSISDMLNEFNRTKSQIAAVIDEHGGVAGIVTVEDVLEEIVGEIWDEFDVQEQEIIQVNDNTINIIAKMDIYDLNEKYGLDISEEDFQTIGGYVFGLLGREPEVGDEVEENGIKYRVDSIDGHKIERLIIQKEDGFIEKQKSED